jgi:hypothetical protein
MMLSLVLSVVGDSDDGDVGVPTHIWVICILIIMDPPAIVVPLDGILGHQLTKFIETIQSGLGEIDMKE